ncbi:MAG: FhaA domain-containing protein [Micromonosporaceae bacterium]
MSVRQRFEKRLEGLVEGAFAKVFKGVVHPVEIVSAMQREAEAHKAILAGGRTLVPNRYVIDLSAYDHGRLAPYAAALAQELAQAQAEHIGEHGWTVYGDVIVEVERGEGLDTGMFRVTAEVFTGGEQPAPGYDSGPGGPHGYDSGPGGPPVSPGPAMPGEMPGAPMSGGPMGGQPPGGMPHGMPGGPPPGPMPGSPAPGGMPPGMPSSGPPAGYPPSDMPVSPGPGGYAPTPSMGQPPPGGGNVRLVSGDGRQYPLAIGSTTIGRGEQASMRLPDVGISRRHARLDFDGSQVVLTDLGSTNGTLVNGQRISAVALNPGDVIQIGTTSLTFRVDG